MQPLFLKIADHFVKINSNSDVFSWDGVDCFIDTNNETPDIVVDYSKKPGILKPDNELQIDERVKWVNALGNEDKVIAFEENEDKTLVLHLLEAKKDFSYAQIYCDVSHRSTNNPFPFLDLVFRNYLITRNGIVIHASAINLNNKALLFTAPSGTGKTTMSNLWNLHKGSQILNSDTPALLTKNGRVIVFGTPWSGSTPVHVNLGVEVEGIVVLEQSKENSIIPLSQAEAFKLILPRFFLPFFDSGLMIKALNVATSVIEKTPCWLLKCRPDQEAVELAYQCIFS